MKDEVARETVAKAAPATAATARPTAAALTPTSPNSLVVQDDFDRAWRRVGLALDRSGFSVEDRDRAAGLFFVRYVDPAQAGAVLGTGGGHGTTSNSARMPCNSTVRSGLMRISNSG
jgi:uncharacterized lipoprotein